MTQRRSPPTGGLTRGLSHGEPMLTCSHSFSCFQDSLSFSRSRFLFLACFMNVAQCRSYFLDWIATNGCHLNYAFFECWERDRMKERDEPYWPFIFRLSTSYEEKNTMMKEVFFLTWWKTWQFWMVYIVSQLDPWSDQMKSAHHLRVVFSFSFSSCSKFHAHIRPISLPFFPNQNTLIFLLSVTDISLSVIISSQRGFKQLLSLAILTCLCHRCYFFSRCDGHVLIVVWCCSLTVPRFL